MSQTKAGFYSMFGKRVIGFEGRGRKLKEKERERETSMRREEKNLQIVLASKYIFMEEKEIFLVPLPLNSFLKNIPSPN